MSLDDSFTENLLQRNKVRKQYKIIKENETPEVLAQKRYALVEEQQIRKLDNVLEESPKRSCEESDEDSPKRPCLEQIEGSPSRQWPPKRHCPGEKENTPVKDGLRDSFLPFKASSNVRGLAALRKTENSGSSVFAGGVTSEAEVGHGRSYMFSTNSTELCTGRKTKLASLAADINQWEDDLPKPTMPSNSVASLASKFSKETCNSSSQPADANVPRVRFAPSVCEATQNINANAPKDFASTRVLSPLKNGMSGRERTAQIKSQMWDQAISATLENEDTRMSPLQPSKVLENKIDNKIERVASNSKPSSNDFVKNKLKLFGNQSTADDLNKSFEPSELPLSARKALFERGINGNGTKCNGRSFEPKLSVAQRAALFENPSQQGVIPKPAPSFTLRNVASPQKLSPSKSPKVANTKSLCSPSKPLWTPEKKTLQDKVQDSPSKIMNSPVKKINTDTHAVEQMLLARVNSNAEMKVLEEREETKVLKTNAALAFWEKRSASKSDSNSEEESHETEQPETADSEMYFSEDDQEDYESETESKYERETESEFNYNTETTEDAYSGGGSDVESESGVEDENVFKTPQGFPLSSKKYTPNKQVLRNMGSYQDMCEDSCDATFFSDNSSYAESYVSTEAISTTETHQSYPSTSSSVGSSYETDSLKESEENSSKSGDGSNSDPNLCYTVSFYRKQKQETRTPPLQTIVRREQVASTPLTTNRAEVIQEQIKLLQEEIVRQNTIIGQTSQALNLCIATEEFSGSTEQVEGERLLLIASQKRQALLNEIQRLKTHGAKGEGVPDGTGTLTITDLQLPLKQEFLAAQLEGRINDAVHWFLCLIRYGAQVIVTQMVSTDDKLSNGALSFTNHIKLQNLPPDFSIVFEVYALQTKKEKLPHEKKYHIKRDKSTLRLTPKSKKSDNKLLVPAITSPGGPNAVRSPSFGVIGFTRFTIQNCHKKCFTLDKVPFTSPLEGVLKVKLHLHAEHKVMEKGFLTMFEDVSGFGAWHRRWCALNDSHLTYWKYPDDENRKVPIGSMDLRQCVTAQVKPVSRDICARPHTFQLVTLRPKEEGDKDTLISQCVNTMTTTKHLLSADTKEERILWCNKLNEALTNVRKWDPQAQYAVELSQD